MAIDTSAFTTVLDMLKGLAGEVKNLANIKKEERQGLQEGLAETAELVDEVLGLVKQELSRILIEFRMGQDDAAAKMLAGLSYFSAWENKYRQFQLCDALRGSLQRIDNYIFPKLSQNALFEDPNVIMQKMHEFIGGEASAAISVSKMLDELSKLSADVSASRDNVIIQLEQARDVIGKLRQEFIDTEIAIREAV